MSYDKRVHPRVPSTAIVEIHHPSLGVYELKARDLSEGGVFVLAGGIYPTPPVGTDILVRIKRLTGEMINAEPIKMRVVHQQRDGVGLAFVR